jgi:hypothetical protein
MEASELDLEIVALKDVLLHEEIEYNRVDKLVERLKTDRVLKNPPMVARAKEQETEKYVVLDGASRSSALRKLNVPDILVQVVDYHSPQVRLESWYHLLLDITPEHLRRDFDELSCITTVDMDEAQAERELDERKILAYLKFSDGRLFGMRCSNELAEQVKELNDVVRAYEAKSELYRVSSTNLEQLVPDRNRQAAVMVFPRYKPDEIIQLALGGVKVPMGITRHIIPGRALRINLPLDVLEQKKPLEDKNRWLKDWLMEKVKHRNVRYYAEPVFLFDE